MFGPVEPAAVHASHGFLADAARAEAARRAGLATAGSVTYRLTLMPRANWTISPIRMARLACRRRVWRGCVVCADGGATRRGVCHFCSPLGLITRDIGVGQAEARQHDHPGRDNCKPVAQIPPSDGRHESSCKETGSGVPDRRRVCGVTSWTNVAPSRHPWRWLVTCSYATCRAGS